MWAWMLCSSTTTPATLLHQLVLGDDFAPGRGQNTEDVERPAAEPHQGLIAPQLAPGEVKPEPAEADLPLDHRIDPD
jgi:hypothetical protein